MLNGLNIFLQWVIVSTDQLKDKHFSIHSWTHKSHSFKIKSVVNSIDRYCLHKIFLMSKTAYQK